MNADDIPVPMSERVRQAWRHVIHDKLTQAFELAPSPEEVVREMAREILRLGDEKIYLTKYPDSGVAELIRELQAEGFDPETE